MHSEFKFDEERIHTLVVSIKKSTIFKMFYMKYICFLKQKNQSHTSKEVVFQI